MASAVFLAVERNMRRTFWLELVDQQFREARAANYRASIVVNTHTGLPIELAQDERSALSSLTPMPKQ